MTVKHQRCEVAEQLAGRADRVIQKLTGFPRKQITGLFDHGCVTVNGVLCLKDFTPVKAGDVVELDYDPHQPHRPKPKPWHDPSFHLVYEDDELLVVDKAAHVLTVPTASQATQGKTLVDAVSRYVNRGRGKRVYVVHRLDRGTSGLLVFGKSYAIAQQIKDQFALHKPRREYVALVAGIVKQDRGTLKSYLATADNLDRYSTDDPDEGELAITHYQVEARLRGITRVRCRLETGKRNQIRVQFAEAGHPVLGDPRYAPEKAAHRLWPHKRLALHATVLEFTHPTTAKPLSFQSPLPKEFAVAEQGNRKS